MNRYTLFYPFLYGNVHGCVFAKNRPVSLNWTDYMSTVCKLEPSLLNNRPVYDIIMSYSQQRHLSTPSVYGGQRLITLFAWSCIGDLENFSILQRLLHLNVCSCLFFVTLAIFYLSTYDVITPYVNDTILTHLLSTHYLPIGNRIGDILQILTYLI